MYGGRGTKCSEHREMTGPLMDMGRLHDGAGSEGESEALTRAILIGLRYLLDIQGA